MLNIGIFSHKKDEYHCIYWVRNLLVAGLLLYTPFMIENLEYVNAHISDGMWLPEDYFESSPICSEKK